MNDVAIEPGRATLLDLLDRLLETGVVVDGEIDLSVAGINLIHLGVKLVLASSATLEPHQYGGSMEFAGPADNPPGGSQAEFSAAPTIHSGSRQLPGAASKTDFRVQSACAAEPVLDSWSSSDRNQPTEWFCPGIERSGGSRDVPARSKNNTAHVANLGERCDFDPSKVEHDLAKLVLTLVELIRRLMEKQAVRRLERGTLSVVQVERLGEAFRRLDIRMGDLKRVFGLQDEQLNVDLGPLGDLM
jgi:gas vesicle protein GvpK/gas vesicle protein GvpA/GvpJ/GvpM family